MASMYPQKHCSPPGETAYHRHPGAVGPRGQDGAHLVPRCLQHLASYEGNHAGQLPTAPPSPTTQGSLGARTVYESTLRTFHTLKAAENWESSPVGVRIPARSPSLSGPQFPHLSSHRLLVSTGSPAWAIRSPPLLTEESEQWAAPVSRLLHGQTRFENSDYSLIKPVGLPVNTL